MPVDSYFANRWEFDSKQWKINKTRKNRRQSHRRQFFRKMSTLNRSVAVWQLYIWSLSYFFMQWVLHFAFEKSSCAKKYSVFAKKTKAIAFEEFILSGNINREDSNWKSKVSVAFHYILHIIWIFSFRNVPL